MFWLNFFYDLFIIFTSMQVAEMGVLPTPYLLVSKYNSRPAEWIFYEIHLVSFTDLYIAPLILLKP
jgi:hypothetical protein